MTYDQVDHGPTEADVINWNEANAHQEEHQEEQEEQEEPCTPERIDGQLVGCGVCADCREQAADELVADEEYE